MSPFGSAEFNHECERVPLFLGDYGLHHSCRRMEIPRAFEEVLNKSSVNLVALPDCRLKVIAEDTIDIPCVTFLPKEQEEGVAVLADGGTEIYHPLIHVLVAGFHLGHLDGLTADLRVDTTLIGALPLRQVQHLHGNLDPRVLGGLLQQGPHPVSPQEDALLRRHGCAIEDVCHVKVDTLGNVSHQEDLSEHLGAGVELVLRVLEEKVLLGSR